MNEAVAQRVTEHRSREPGRGREAGKPTEIPTAGWKDILYRVWDEIGNDRVGTIAAGTTFFVLLALFPALAALVSIYGLVADPATIQEHVNDLSGYVPAEMNRGPETTIGVVPIDSIFSPVTRVSYEVEAARVGQRTDYDKLRLDVTTDGSINPRDAIAEAAEILIRGYAIFTDLEKIEGFAEAAGVEGTDVPTTSHGMENFPIEELELGVRSYNCLKRVGIETIGDLIAKSEQELAAIPNFGKKSIEEVKETLGAHGLKLRGDE